MRNNKSYKRDRRDYEDEEGYDHNRRRKETKTRRPIRNWTKAWEEHQNDLDSFEDVFSEN